MGGGRGGSGGGGEMQIYFSRRTPPNITPKITFYVQYFTPERLIQYAKLKMCSLYIIRWRRKRGGGGGGG